MNQTEAVAIAKSNIFDIERVIRIYADVTDETRKSMLGELDNWRKRVGITDWKKMTNKRYTQINSLTSWVQMHVPDYWGICVRITPSYYMSGQAAAVDDRHYQYTGEFLRGTETDGGIRHRGQNIFETEDKASMA